MISEEGATDPNEHPELRAFGLGTLHPKLPNQATAYHAKLTAHGIGNRKLGPLSALPKI